MSTTLRKRALATESIFAFVERYQDSRYRGCTGARELAALWYRVRKIKPITCKCAKQS